MFDLYDPQRNYFVTLIEFDRFTSSVSDIQRTRRWLLHGLGTTGLLTIAGCQSNESGDDLSEDNTVDSSSGSPEPTNSDSSGPTRLVADERETADRFGEAVALVGNTALVGAEFDNNQNGEKAGAVYVFQRTSGGWQQQQVLLPDDGEPGQRFGRAIAIQDGTALIGARNDATQNGDNAGSVYVYERTDDWSQEDKLVPRNGDRSEFFGSAIGFDGNTALIGAPNDVVNGEVTGSTYVFTRDGTSWSQQSRITPDASSSGDFGSQVALVGDTALVGTPDGNVATVYYRDEGAWMKQARLNSDDAEDDSFGEALALTEKRAIIGAEDSGSGAAFVFSRDTGWEQQAKLTATSGSRSFGSMVLFDGTTAVIGDREGTQNGEKSGLAYVFVDSGEWRQRTKLVPPNGRSGDEFAGFSAGAISEDTILISSREDEQKGAVYAFDI